MLPERAAAFTVVAGEGGVHDLRCSPGGYAGAGAMIKAEQIVHHALNERLLDMRRMGDVEQFRAACRRQPEGCIVEN